MLFLIGKLVLVTKHPGKILEKFMPIFAILVLDILLIFFYLTIWSPTVYLPDIIEALVRVLKIMKFMF